MPSTNLPTTPEVSLPQPVAPVDNPLTQFEERAAEELVLLDSIDERQAALMSDIDKLNAEAEALLGEFTNKRKQTDADESAAPVADQSQ